MSWLGTRDDGQGAAEQKGRYRVDLYQHQYDFWMEYTHLKRPVTLEMAQGLADGLRRQGAGCRIVEEPSGRIIEQHKACPHRDLPCGVSRADGGLRTCDCDDCKECIKTKEPRKQ